MTDPVVQTEPFELDVRTSIVTLVKLSPGGNEYTVETEGQDVLTEVGPGNADPGRAYLENLFKQHYADLAGSHREAKGVVNFEEVLRGNLKDSVVPPESVEEILGTLREQDIDKIVADYGDPTEGETQDVPVSTEIRFFVDEVGVTEDNGESNADRASRKSFEEAPEGTPFEDGFERLKTSLADVVSDWSRQEFLRLLDGIAEQQPR